MKLHPVYERYPMMLPHVGTSYIRGDPRSLLLVGESHYLPKGSTQHQSAESWYGGDRSTLNDTEKGWIDTAGIIAASSAEGFRNKAHSIYRKAFQEINRGGPNYPDYRCVGNIVVFYNYYLRPAFEGDSLRIVDEDERVAVEVFRSVFNEYRPGAVVFLSKLAHRSWQTGEARMGIAAPPLRTLAAPLESSLCSLRGQAGTRSPL